MIIIGEKINGFIPKTLAAIETQDAEYIRQLAKAQTKAGANYLDICAGTSQELEQQTLEWLIGLVQESCDTPLCLDSSDPQLLLDMRGLVQRAGLLNSVSMETVDDGRTKCDVVFPVIAESKWGVVALTCDQNGIPDDPEIKLEIARKMIDQAAETGIAPERIFIDPLVTTLATKQDSLANFTEAIHLIHAEYPTVHFTSGLSNISFGMPFRRAINTQFLALAMAAGMDSAIMDPTSPSMQATLHATNALLGKDEYCMDYLQAYRDGMFEATPRT
ncbi:MAG: dihydropteroate synthase [Coriobacteriales bacterium]|jgi:5-methyltetrahydrofolate--homocysteine methyltransferase|nr:dihydropteroate synthase [Coriobacteriales bacterium]